jgi:uncharacterized protein (TIGR02118 family)
METTMIRVTVLYANKPGSRFDHDYYREKHMPLVKERLADHCSHYAIDRGLAGATPGSMPPYVASCHLFCDSLQGFYTEFAPHASEILADIANYTDLEPIVQISEIVVGEEGRG